MRVVFCTSGTGAELGETHTAAMFAKELMNKNHHCYFIAPIVSCRYLVTMGFPEVNIFVPSSPKPPNSESILEANQRSFNAFMTSCNPDFVIMADWHQFTKEGVYSNSSYHLSWFNEDLIFGTFDHMGFSPEGNTVKVHPGLKILDDRLFCPLPSRYKFVIKPCPHHSNKVRKEDNTYYWSLLNADNDQEYMEVLNATTSNDDYINIFHPIGFWQERTIQNAFIKNSISANYYFDILIPIIINYLSCIEKPIRYLVVSGDQKEERIEQIGNVELKVVPALKHNSFLENLAQTDLFITDNIMSSSLGKALFYNKKAVVLINTLLVEDFNKNDAYKLSSFIRGKVDFLIDNDMLFPYVSFPVGFSEMKTMYNDNLFSETFHQLELFNENESRKKFIEILTMNTTSEVTEKKQDLYIANNKRLMSAEEILQANL